MATLWPVACRATDAGLQDDVQAILAEEELTGIAWALVGDSGETNIGVAGLRDNHTGSAFTPDTRFHVGSITKSLLATGVLRLATEGRIDLDAPALSYLPELSFDNPWGGSSNVTVRHLLDHTSGLSDAHMWHLFSERADPDVPLINAFPDPGTQLRIRSQPGARFSYSNMGYTLLGMIIESVVGERYESYLDRSILVPLSMRDSTFTFTTQQGESADPTLAWGHVDGGLRHAASPVFLRPAGQFTTTATDLARFATFLMGNGVVDNQLFVDETLMRSRAKPIGTEAATEGLIAGYSLGIGRRDRHGVVGFCHGGNVVGFAAMLCVFPEEQKAFAYSVNMDSETADYGRLESAFKAALNIAHASPPQTRVSSADMAEWYGRYVLNPNRFQQFEYLDTVFGAIKISPDGDALVLTSLQNGARQLRPVGDRLYSAGDRSTASHVFLQGREGEYLLSDGFRTFERVSTVFLAAHWASFLLGVVGLVFALCSGCISIIRHRSRMLRQPVAPAFIASVLLFAPVPLFFQQSFMALGDFTLASALLAVVTFLLPVGMLVTIFLVRWKWSVSQLSWLDGVAAAFVLQWCVVLAAEGLLPFRIWT